MKKILSLLTVAILSASSVSSATAFTTKRKNQSIENETNFTKAIGIANNVNIRITIEINNEIYIGTDHGLYISSDAYGTDFQKAMSIPGDTHINAITKINNKIYIGTGCGLYVSSDWINFAKVTTITSDNFISIIKKVDNKIYIGTNHCLLVSTDNGKTFKQVESILRYLLVTAITKINNKIYVGTIEGFYVSSDGINFTKISDLGLSLINSIQQINNKIYVGTGVKGLYVSSDGAGTNFKQVISIPNNATIKKIQQINNQIYVGTFNGLYISKDDGKTFSQVSLLPINIKIFVIKEINNKIYVGTSNGVYISSDGAGTNFKQESSIPKNIDVDTVTQINDKIYVGTSNGVYYKINSNNLSNKEKADNIMSMLAYHYVEIPSYMWNISANTPQYKTEIQWALNNMMLDHHITYPFTFYFANNDYKTKNFSITSYQNIKIGIAVNGVKCDTNYEADINVKLTKTFIQQILKQITSKINNTNITVNKIANKNQVGQYKEEIKQQLYKIINPKQVKYDFNWLNDSQTIVVNNYKSIAIQINILGIKFFLNPTQNINVKIV